jgi:Lon protease (S16) C-terminal proteolytic domain
VKIHTQEREDSHILTSVLTDRTVRSDTAMTGEISLRGLVLPVGGIKEKVVAAAAAGLTRVMLPARNRRDFDEIPLGARNKLEFIWLEFSRWPTYDAFENSIVCLTTWHCLSEVRKAMSEASRPLPIRTMPSIGASLVGSISHQPFSR